MQTILKKTTGTLFALALLSASPAIAQMQHGAGHGGGHGAAPGAGAAPGERHGDLIRESTVEGYALAYHLIDNAAQMQAAGVEMKGHDMSQMKSHHLMVYLAAPGGTPAAGARVGYLVRGPGGSEQKTMAAFMDGGYGADLELKTPGTYEITTRAVDGGKNLVDTFAYEVR
ncbi:MAG: hypothetical protein AB1578_01845 [Thermodesulfobacteriota bacterium]